ncbi:MAG: universal stress protein [Chlorobiaceae bacterium]|jgi:universal stress protein A|nr:universal stress protein [Chlorobiaceae bacterium]NTV16717.1 universal stress protein [Chlorobiaceae bacterium]
MFKIYNILCPVDFSDASRKAVRYAYEFAVNMRASIVLLNIIDIPIESLVNNMQLDEELEKSARQELVALKNELLSEGLKVEILVEIGIPADVILDQAAKRDVNLIIMGSHGKKGVTRLVLGSVAETVLRKADCPVLIVKSVEKEFIEE